MSCFAPSNFSVQQAAYVDSSCWDSLVHHEQDEAGKYKTKSLWPHKVKQTQLSVRPAERKGSAWTHTALSLPLLRLLACFKHSSNAH